MAAVLLDTDVFSFFYRGDTRRDLYAADIAGRQWCVSFQSVAELLRWTIERKWSDSRRASLEQSIRRCIVIPYDAAMASHWASATAHRKALGRPLACGDAWIAASALRHGIPLVSHNGAHFRDIPGLTVISHPPMP